jgi:hypothetical protein
MYTKFWLENVEGRDHFKVLSVNGKIFENGSYGTGMGRHGLDASGSE